jgi:VWFA-related protein
LTKTNSIRLLATLVISVALCQPGARRLAAQDKPLFSSESALVVLHVTVKDKHGRYVNGLTRSAFDVFEDGKPQDIPFFTAEDAPVTLGLLIDTSGSMRNNRTLMLTAAEAFVERSNPRDEIFALTFNDTVTAALPTDQPFTNDADVLRHALAESITTVGRTALYDAIDDGVEYLAAGQYERKVLVVVSDGGDNASETTLDMIRRRIQASNVVIHAVSLVDPLEPESNPKRLRQLAEASGGLAFAPRDAGEVQQALEHVAIEIRSAYTMGYVPADATPGYRRLRVGVRASSAGTVVVRTRAGYMAGPGSTRKP